MESEKKEILEKITVVFNIKEANVINHIPGFIPASQYYKDEEIPREEWGKMVFGTKEIRFHCSSKVIYSIDKVL